MRRVPSTVVQLHAVDRTSAEFDSPALVASNCQSDYQSSLNSIVSQRVDS